MGAAVGDYDNGGWADLFVTAYGRCTLDKNNHHGTFTDVTEMAGVASPGWTTSRALPNLFNTETILGMQPAFLKHLCAGANAWNGGLWRHWPKCKSHVRTPVLTRSPVDAVLKV